MPYPFFYVASWSSVKHSQCLEKSFFFFFKAVFAILRIHQTMMLALEAKELWASNICSKVMAVMKVTNYFFCLQWLPLLYPFSFIHYQRQ